MRLSGEPTVVIASEVWVELRCVPGDVDDGKGEKLKK